MTSPGSSNSNFTAATGPLVFDTWSGVSDGPYDYTGWDPGTPPSAPSTTTVPFKIQILALQITLRVWDARTQQTRQVTMIQDM
jgi:hypothetical protein